MEVLSIIGEGKLREKQTIKKSTMLTGAGSKSFDLRGVGVRGCGI